jgi:DDE superfamily endonuclease
MLPACRTEGKAEAPPPLALAQGDVEGFLHEWRSFHDAFRSCFSRREPREHFVRSMVGQLRLLERKSIEPMALEVEGGNVRAMQRFVSDDLWDEAQMRHIDHQLVYEDRGAPDGIVIVDASGVPKTGQDSVGVARQYCVGLWATSRTVKSAGLRPRRRRMAMPLGTSSCSSRSHGSRRPMRSVAPSAKSQRTWPSRPSPSWLAPWCARSSRREYCLSSTWWLMVWMATVRIFLRTWRPAGG